MTQLKSFPSTLSSCNKIELDLRFKYIDQTNFGGSHIKLRVHASARKSLNIDIIKTFAIDFKLFYYIL